MATRKLVVDARTEEMPLPVLECREMGHAWSRLPMRLVKQAYRSAEHIEISRMCSRCHTERLDTYDPHSFELLDRTYQYAENYLLSEPGTGALPRGEVRKALFVRDGG